MITVAMVSQKGGAGKTTLAVALAVAHELADGGAVVADVDPQGTAAMWGGLRTGKDSLPPLWSLCRPGGWNRRSPPPERLARAWR